MQIDIEDTGGSSETLQAAVESPDFYKKLLDQMSDGVSVVDRKRQIRYWNQGAERLTGYSAQEIVEHACADHALCQIDAEQEMCAKRCPLEKCMSDGANHETRVFLRNKHGRRVPIKLRTQPLRDSAGKVIGAVEILSDASAEHEIHRRAEAMRRMAFLDHLTQLPNRRFLEMSLQALLNAHVTERNSFGVLMIDLDDFKEVNDTHGHNSGDQVLKEIARTLSGALRPSDLIGRWGGDEFLAIVSDIHEKALENLARRCVTLAEHTPLHCNGKPLLLSISAGATLAQTGDSLQTLIERADQLMYRSKADGRGRATME